MDNPSVLAMTSSPFGCLVDPTSCPSSLSKVLTSHCSGCAVASPRAFSHEFVVGQFFAADTGAVQERGSGDEMASDGVTGRPGEQPHRNGFVSNDQPSYTSSTTCRIYFSEADTVHRIGSSLLRGVFAACGVEQCAKSFQARRKEDRGAKIFSDAVQSTTTFKTVTASNHP